MEPTRHCIRHHQSVLLALQFQLSVLPRLAVALVVTFAVLIGGFSLAPRSTPLPVDPFAPFADVLPGSPRSAVVARGFACAMATYPILPDEYCTLDLETGIITHIGVVVSRQTVTRTDYTLREGALRLGDLALAWGSPNALNRRLGWAFWTGSGGYASAAFSGWRNPYFLPIRLVAFRATGT